ncbi:MAG: ATP-dependent sacrificial sulfur transferase LarE [Methermicoccaceae archaeon]
MKNPEDILRELKEFFEQIDKVIVAFSGGVDSSVLAMVGYNVLENSCMAVTAHLKAMSKRELLNAQEIAQWIGIPHHIIQHNELTSEYIKNSANRCYYCKKDFLMHLRHYGHTLGVDTIVEGTNADELAGHRPGFKAVNEIGALTPLTTYNKSEIRSVAKFLGLPNWDAPPMACLSSRIPYEMPITERMLRKVEHAEDIIFSMGFRIVRARLYDEEMLRIEVGEDEIPKAIAMREEIISHLKPLGVRDVLIDLKGYRPQVPR